MNPDSVWRLVRGLAGLEDVRCHDLRHAFVSDALEMGFTVDQIGPLIGQTSTATTERYAHLAKDAAARMKADISGEISKRNAGERNKVINIADAKKTS